MYSKSHFWKHLYGCFLPAPYYTIFFFLLLLGHHDHHVNMLLFFPSPKRAQNKKTSIDDFSQQPQPHFLVMLCSKAPLIPPLLNLLQSGFVHVKVTVAAIFLSPVVISVLVSWVPSAAFNTEGHTFFLAEPFAWLSEPHPLLNLLLPQCFLLLSFCCILPFFPTFFFQLRYS